MQEAFLHYLWKFKKFRWENAITSDGKALVLISVGTHNQSESGPDFFNAKLKIGDQMWAGNVEIHLKTSDWYAHNHETDPAYDNVILHVVWENDSEIFRKNNVAIPTLELRELVAEKTLHNYQNLLVSGRSKWINCEKDFETFNDFKIDNWLERMYVERLEQKSGVLSQLLAKSTNNWEATLFAMLAKNFGLNVNGDAFLDMAISTPFSVVQKSANRPEQLEALFFGQAGMLEAETEAPYFHQLKKEYGFLKQKFGLQPANNFPVKYFRLRPDNFPTIRLAQLASLYALRKQLFSKTIAAQSKEKLYDLFQVETSKFWQTHYTFQKESNPETSGRRKKLTKNFVDLLLINTVVPIKFHYAKSLGKSSEERIFSLMKSGKPETNSVVAKFNKLRKNTATDALGSQALLHLKKNYCDKNRCLQCALGLELLQKN